MANRGIIKTILNQNNYKGMETKLNLYQKLLKIQENVKGLGKDKQGHGYQYVTGSKVLEHIKPLMIEYGVILKQEVISIDNVRQDYILKNGNSKSEILSKVMMRFTWIDTETGDKDENLFGANGQNDWDKGVGSALTYGERYFLLKYFHINTDEDDIDNPERKEQGESAPIPSEQILEKCTTEDELKAAYLALPKPEQVRLKTFTSDLKKKLTSKNAA